jgi:hypothetical protein
MGVVWSTSNHCLTLPVTNRSSKQIIVESIDVSCGCTEVPGLAFPILLSPGEHFDLPLVIDLAGKPALGQPVRDFAAGVYVNLQDEAASKFVVRARVRDAFWFDRGHDLEIVGIADGLDCPETSVLLHTRPEMTGLEVETDVNGLSVVLTRCELSGQFRLSLTALPRDDVHLAEGYIKLSGFAGDSTRIASSYPVRVRFVPDMRFDPEMPHLGAIPVGTDRSIEFQVVSRSGREFGQLECLVANSSNADVSVGIVDERTLRGTVRPNAVGQVAVDLLVIETTSNEMLPGRHTAQVRLTAEAY